MTKEKQIYRAKKADIEYVLLGKLKDLKYTYHKEIRNKEVLELNFRKKFKALNSVKITEAEFDKLLIETKHPDIFKSFNYSKKRNTRISEEVTPQHYTLVDIKDLYTYNIKSLDDIKRKILGGECEEYPNYYHLIDHSISLQETKTVMISKHNLHNDEEKKGEFFK